ncbi:hypothetical protein [Micromonospora zhanjiangensis]
MTGRGIRRLVAAGAVGLVVATTGCGEPGDRAAPVRAFGSWDEVLAEAGGQTVNLYLGDGSATAEAYVDQHLAPAVARYGVRIVRVPGVDAPAAVDRARAERRAGRDADGAVDLVRLSGDAFAAGRRDELWRCGYPDLMPNNKLESGRFPVSTRTAALREDHRQPRPPRHPVQRQARGGGHGGVERGPVVRPAVGEGETGGVGAYPAIALDRLTREENLAFSTVLAPRWALSFAEPTVHASPEVRPEWASRIDQDWQREIARR